MIITGRHGDYDVRYSKVGYTYAEILVYTVKTRKIKLGFIEFERVSRTKVWESRAGRTALNYDALDKMYPKPLRELFQYCVDEYENYIDAWNAEHDISIPANEVSKQRLIDS